MPRSWRKTDRLKSGKTHDQEHTRQWVGNALAGLGDSLTNVTHVIIHTYGADAWYTCGIKGIEKTRFTQRAYPELAGKQLWITEWRDRSDEDWICQRKFRTVLFKAQYLLMTLGQRDVEATAIHEARVLSGIFCYSNGEYWRQPMDNKNRKRRFPDRTGTGHPHAVTAGAAGVYRLFNEALDVHPRILAYGAPSGDLSCTKYYESSKRRWEAIRKGAEVLPPVDDDPGKNPATGAEFPPLYPNGHIAFFGGSCNNTSKIVGVCCGCRSAKLSATLDRKGLVGTKQKRKQGEAEHEETDSWPVRGDFCGDGTNGEC